MTSKLLALVFSLAVSSMNALAVTPTSASLTADGNVAVEVTYSGGCFEHTFGVKRLSCQNIGMKACSYQIEDLSRRPDRCEAMVVKTLVFTPAQLGFPRGNFLARFVKRASSATHPGAPAVSVVVPYNPNAR